MADQISFESEGAGAPYAAIPQVNQAPTLVRLVMRLRLAGGEQGAKAVLLGVAGFAVILAVTIPLFLSTSNPRVPQPQVDAALRTPVPQAYPGYPYAR